MLLYCRMYAALAMLFSWPRSRTHLRRSCSFRGGPCSRPPEICCRVGVSAPAGGNFLPTLNRQKQQFHMHRWCDLFCGFAYMSYMITCENTLDKTTRTGAAPNAAAFPTVPVQEGVRGKSPVYALTFTCHFRLRRTPHWGAVARECPRRLYAARVDDPSTRESGLSAPGCGRPQRTPPITPA